MAALWTISSSHASEAPGPIRVCSKLRSMRIWKPFASRVRRRFTLSATCACAMDAVRWGDHSKSYLWRFAHISLLLAESALSLAQPEGGYQTWHLQHDSHESLAASTGRRVGHGESLPGLAVGECESVSIVACAARGRNRWRRCLCASAIQDAVAASDLHEDIHGVGADSQLLCVALPAGSYLVYCLLPPEATQAINHLRLIHSS